MNRPAGRGLEHARIGEDWRGLARIGEDWRGWTERLPNLAISESFVVSQCTGT